MAVMYNYAIPPMFEVVRVTNGQEQPTSTFSEHATLFLKLQFAIIVLFWTSLWAVKFSFLMFYRRLFVGLPVLMRCWYAVGAFSLVAYLGCWATQLDSCIPISSYFVIGACETRRDVYVSNLSLYYSTAVDILCDLFVMALPLRLLWGLQISRRQKIALAAIFSLGFIIIIFAIVRVTQTSASSHHVDPVWLALWSVIEASVAVIVSCLPSFRVLVSTGTVSFYKGNPTSTSCSRNSRNHKGATRLDQLDVEANNIGGMGKARGGVRMEHTAIAERLDPVVAEAEARESAGVENRETKMPPVPNDVMLVRNDFYLTTETI
ncbi:hypothetical protein MMC12_003358 [Toensbergia leucococca]|nr:hypothetical protein [Toensbergia leucococca]